MIREKRLGALWLIRNGIRYNDYIDRKDLIDSIIDQDIPPEPFTELFIDSINYKLDGDRYMNHGSTIKNNWWFFNHKKTNISNHFAFDERRIL